MNDGWWVLISLYILSTPVVFLGNLIEWLDNKDRYSGKKEATIAARWMALAPIWPLALTCYLLYKSYLLFPDFINDVRGTGE